MFISKHLAIKVESKTFIQFNRIYAFLMNPKKNFVTCSVLLILKAFPTFVFRIPLTDAFHQPSYDKSNIRHHLHQYNTSENQP
jgi:hypothetical protein